MVVNARWFTIGIGLRWSGIMKPKLIIGNKNYSSWSLRPWLLMKEAGIDFEEHRIVLDTPKTKREIAEFSDAGRVPILLLGEATVWDSLAICETVAERWPDKQLWPAPRRARACARDLRRNALRIPVPARLYAHELPGDGAQSAHSR